MKERSNLIFFRMRYLCLLFCFSYSFGYKLPQNINLCHRSKPDFAECVGKNVRSGLEAFSHGNKELSVPLLEPYFVEKMEIKPSDSTKSLYLHQIFTNVNVYGMTDTDIVHFESNFDTGCSWVMDAVSPKIELLADYELKGKVLVFPLNSHGKCNVTQAVLRNRHSMWCEKYKKNGKTHIRFINYTMDMRPDQIYYKFNDIFPTNKDIEREIGKTISENSLQIFNEVKSAFEEIFSLIHMQVANLILSRIPFDEIFLP